MVPRPFSLARLRAGFDRLPFPTPPALTAHLGRVTITVRPNRNHATLRPFPRGRFVGSVGLGPVAASWLRRNPGSVRWGLEPVGARRARS